MRDHQCISLQITASICQESHAANKTILKTENYEIIFAHYRCNLISLYEYDDFKDDF